MARADAGPAVTACTASSACNQNAVRDFVTALAYVGSTSATIAVRAELVAAVTAAVKSTTRSGRIAADDHDQIV
jgi:hypothetical protein